MRVQDLNGSAPIENKELWIVSCYQRLQRCGLNNSRLRTQDQGAARVP